MTDAIKPDFVRHFVDGRQSQLRSTPWHGNGSMSHQVNLHNTSPEGNRKLTQQWKRREEVIKCQVIRALWKLRNEIFDHRSAKTETTVLLTAASPSVRFELNNEQADFAGDYVDVERVPAVERQVLADFAGDYVDVVRVPAVERRVLAVERRVPAVERRVPAVERRVPAVERQVPAVERWVLAVERRVPAVERRVPAVERRVPTVERRVPAVERRVLAVERRVPAVERRVPAVERQVLAVEGRVPAVERRVVQLGLDRTHCRRLGHPF
ncbi:hypothetical protein ACOMHN_066574 [Nucella lapillus]